MDLHIFAVLSLLISSCLLAIESREERSSRSVVFFDSPSHSYIRQQPLGIPDETNSMQLDEVAAAVSVLIGLKPPSSLPVESSSKLNDVLLPNPFERPDTIVLLEVGEIDDHLFFSIQQSDIKVGNSFRRTLVGPKKANIHVSGDEDVKIIHLDETACDEDNNSCVDQELIELANGLGGSYTGSIGTHDGWLTIHMSTGGSLDLNISKEADRAFATSLASLVENTKRSTLLNEFLQSSKRTAELYVGRFRGLEALKVEYGHGNNFKLGEQLLKDSLVKLLNIIQTSSGGRVVCVLLSSMDANKEKEDMLEFTRSLHFTRWLDEVSSGNETIAEIKQVLLVRRTLAWITAIILLVSTLVGVYFLLYMPLTRDTLLYSNVKLD